MVSQQETHFEFMFCKSELNWSVESNRKLIERNILSLRADVWHLSDRSVNSDSFQVPFMTFKGCDKRSSSL